MLPPAPGVSTGAVSFALNNRPGVAPATRRRILDVATDLGWQPSLRARSLSRSTSFTLGLVIARSATSVGTDPFFPAFVAGVNTMLVRASSHCCSPSSRTPTPRSRPTAGSPPSNASTA